jgi:anti-sigma regulatory factor (Ser/Thr protein kinase)
VTGAPGSGVAGVGGEAVIDTTILNSLREIPRVAQMVDALGAEYHLSPEVVYDVQLALEEILTNVITHGYSDDQVHQISIRLNLGDGMVTVEIVDDGGAFNLLEAPRPDLTAGLRERAVGGLGIYFVRTLMDHVEYSRGEGKNRLVVKRRTGA